MPTCSFCKKMYKSPRGLTIFTFDGRSIFYCSSKCRRNAELGRDPKKTGWVKKTKKDKSEKKVVSKPEKVEKVEKEEDKEKSLKKDEKKADKVEKTVKKPVVKKTDKKK